MHKSIIPSGERVMWEGKPPFLAHALSWSKFLIFGLIFIPIFGYPMRNLLTIDHFKGLIDFFGVYGYVFIFMQIIPLIFVLATIIVPLVLMFKTYGPIKYVITNKSVIAPAWSGHFEMRTINRRSMTLGSIGSFRASPKHKIKKVEIKKGLLDRLFGTGSIWIYFQSSLYKEESGLYSVVIFKNIKDPMHVKSILK